MSVIRGAIDRRTFVGWTAAIGVAGSVAAKRARGQSPTQIVLLEGTSPPDPICHYFFYARENGFYRKAGLDVDIKTITAETVAMRALLANDGDVAFVGGISALQAAAAGARVKCISAFAQKLDYLIVANKEVTALKQFEGRGFAVSQVGAVSHTVPRLMIEKAGGDTQKVRWVSVGNSAARLQGLIMRAFDGAAVNTAFASRAARYNYLYILADAGEQLPHLLYTWEIGSPNAVQNKTDALTAFVKATAEGARWGTANPDQAAEISKKILPDLPPEEVAASIRRYAANGFWSQTGVLSRETWDYTTAVALQNGDIKAALKYDDFFDPRFSQS